MAKTRHFVNLAAVLATGAVVAASTVAAQGTAERQLCVDVQRFVVHVAPKNLESARRTEQAGQLDNSFV